MKIKNKPVFPVDVSMDEHGNLRGSQTINFSGFAMGLTKREYFTAKAMQGLLSNPDWTESDKIAEVAIKIADNILSKLSKEQEL